MYEKWGNKAKYVEAIAKAKGFDRFLEMDYYEMLASYRGLPVEAYYGLIEDVFETEKAKNIIEVSGGLNASHIYILANEIMRKKTGTGIGNQTLVNVLMAMAREGKLKQTKEGRAKVYVLRGEKL